MYVMNSPAIKGWATSANYWLDTLYLHPMAMFGFRLIDLLFFSDFIKNSLTNLCKTCVTCLLPHTWVANSSCKHGAAWSTYPFAPQQILLVTERTILGCQGLFGKILLVSFMMLINDVVNGSTPCPVPSSRQLHLWLFYYNLILKYKVS